MDNNQRDQLFEVLNRLKKIRHSTSAFEGLPQGEFFMLHTIARCIKEKQDTEDDSGIKVSVLSLYLHMSKPAVSQMLNSLESKGLIERRVAKNDRRLVLVSLTADGNALMEENHKKLVETVDDLIQKFGESDTKTLISLLNKLYDILESMHSANHSNPNKNS